MRRVWSGWAIRHRINPDARLATIHGVRAIDTIRWYGASDLELEREAAMLFGAELADVAGIVPIAGTAVRIM